MRLARGAVLSCICLIALGIYPQELMAEGFNNSDFLLLKDEEKKLWLLSSIDTLGFVAGYKDTEQGRCVWEWYYKDVSNKNGLILAYMGENPDKSPSAILIALTESACGVYVRGKRS